MSDEKNALVVVNATDALIPAELLEDERELVARAISNNTKRAYLQDWKKFEAWCRSIGGYPLPATPAMLRGYVTWLTKSPTEQTGKPTRPGSIGRALAAIAWFHQNTPGLEDYAATKTARLRLVLKGARRELKVAQKGKEPFLWGEVLQASRSIEPGTAACDRDRALLLLGFAAALRRSEIVSLLASDLEFRDGGLVVWFGRVDARSTKGDQEASGLSVAITKDLSVGTECPVENARYWLDRVKHSKRPDGPLFRPVDRHGNVLDRQLADVISSRLVKREVKKLNKNPRNYSGHSLRSGCATTLATMGVPLDMIRAHLRQKNVQTTIGYVRRATRLTPDENAWAKMIAGFKVKP